VPEQHPRTEAAFARWARSMLARVTRESDVVDTPADRRERNEFYGEYFGYLMMPGIALQSRVALIERFVRLQSVPHEGARFALHYHSPRFPNGVVLYVSEWGDVDFCDVEGIVLTDVLQVRALDGSKWTAARIEELLRHLEDDLGADGVTVRLSASEPGGALITVSGDWDVRDS